MRPAAGSIPVIQGHHPRHGAEHTGYFVGQGHWREHRRCVGEPSHSHVAAHALGDGAEARPVLVRPGLAETRKTENHQPRVGLMQLVRPKSPTLHYTRAEPFDQDVGLLSQFLQYFLAGGVGQVEGNGLLVAGVDFPPEGNAVHERPPVAQRVPGSRPFHLNDLGAEVGHQAAGSSSGNYDGKVQYLQALQRPCWVSQCSPRCTAFLKAGFVAAHPRHIAELYQQGSTSCDCLIPGRAVHFINVLDAVTSGHDIVLPAQGSQGPTRRSGGRTCRPGPWP